MPDPIAYTDGACLGNPGPGGWGVRIYFPDGHVEESGGAEALTTNNRMELQAAIEALRRLTIFPRATVVTDSRYVIDGLTRWIPAWQRRDWRTVAGTPVKNQHLWMTLQQLYHPGICWQHVRGHTGDPDNERVDTIARAFARGETPALFVGRAGAPSDPVSAEASVISRSPRRQRTAGDRVRYVSIVQGTVALDDEWATCEARVRGVAGARYKKVRNDAELAAFCSRYGVDPPP